MIPKVIHYCWFGGKPLPALESTCVETWHKVMPDYEIVRWDETNYDIDACAFSRVAYEAKRYAFVSDYARYKILLANGGIFLDTDVKALKKFDDLLNQGGFVGFMQNNQFVNPGLVMAYDNAAGEGRLFHGVIDDYESRTFELSKGRNSMPTSPRVLTSILESQYGLQRNGTMQHLPEGFTVYPASYFDPLDSHTGMMHVTDDTYSVHLYSGTWLSPAKKYRIETRKKLAPKVGPQLPWFISSAVSVLKYGKDAF